MKDEIADIIYYCGGSDFCYDAAGKILATLTGEFEVVEECPTCSGRHPEYCSGACHGSGTIVRPATIEEILEAAKFIAEHTYRLKDGARLRVKRGGE